MNPFEHINRVFEGSTSYELLGHIHWIINVADNLNENLCKIQSKEQKRGFYLVEELFSEHGTKYCGREISWWINQKENNFDILLTKTKELLPYVENLYKDFHLFKSNILKSYDELLYSIKEFNDKHLSQIQKFHEYVEYLANEDPICPILLFSSESSWSCTELSERSFREKKSIPSDDDIKFCANIVLGLCSTTGSYVYNRIRSEIECEMYDHFDGVTPFSSSNDQNRLAIQVSRKVLDEYEAYLKNIRESLRDIIKEIKRFNSKSYVIREIQLDFPNKSRIKVAIIQLDYDLTEMEGEFGYCLIDELSQKEKILSAIHTIDPYTVDIICFPELSINKEWVEVLCKLSMGKIIVGGSYYDQAYNISPLIVNGQLIKPSYKKIFPSPYEGTEIFHKKMKSGKIVFIYKTPQFSFTILTCIDNPKLSSELLSNPENSIDLVINPCYDEKISRFQNQCDNLCENTGAFFIQINRSGKEGKFGNSSIMASEHRVLLEKLNGKTRTESIDLDSVIATISEEGIIIADIDTSNKGPTKPTRLNYVGRVSPIQILLYSDGKWIEQFPKTYN